MKRIIPLATLFTAISLTSAGPLRAAEGPWCALRNFGSDLSEDCQYRTFEECQVTQIAGFRGFCNPNPRWQGGVVDPRLRRKG